jgi:hypothetical protein
MSTRSLRRALVGAAALLSVAGPIAMAPSAGAHTCARVEVWVDGSVKAAGSCHEPPGSTGDLCSSSGVTPAGTGVIYIACVLTP